MARVLWVMVAMCFLGCDDPAVSDKALELLEHGAIHAQVRCVAADPNRGPSSTVFYRASLMQDGSCLASIATSAAFLGVTITSRSAADAGKCPAVFETDQPLSWVYTVQDGAFKAEVIQSSPIPLYTIASIGDACTGVNLEAFGG
jgi:hypothetical protein